MLQNIDCGYSLEPPELNTEVIGILKQLKCTRTGIEQSLQNIEIITRWNQYLVFTSKSIYSTCMFTSRKHVRAILYIPLKPHLHIEKLGYSGLYIFFLFLLQNIDCGYSLEPPR